MSGICGLYHHDNGNVSIDQAASVMKAYRCYPADEIDTWRDQKVFLGCHNQWITPESVGEKLPYYDYSRNLAITADAIIDNREELFDKLQVQQADRSGFPDSHLILLAYSKWGNEAPKFLIGDFAFMIWDGAKQKLFGARDFSGSRTLYFYNDYARFAFSTLIEPLFELPYVEKQLNEEWIAEFLTIPTMVESVDMQTTVYKKIRQLPPSHSITVEKGKASLSRYFTFKEEVPLNLRSNEEYHEAFINVFQKAIKARVRTHGEVGSHLSGGMDSGTVVSFAAKELQNENKKLRTYSYIPQDSFKDWTPKWYIPDERPYIKETVQFVGNIEDHYLSFPGRSPLSDLDDFLSLMEMPYKFFENSYWLKGLSETAHKDGVKVLLSGARGNHSISWGSYNLTMEYYADLLKKFKWVHLFKELDRYCQTFRTGKSNVLPFVAKTAFPQIANLRSKKFEYRFPRFINPSLVESTKVYDKLKEYGLNPNNGSMADNLNDHRINHYEKLFTWNKSGTATTKLSLRYSLWDRDPTNDLNVIRFCMSLPKELYVRNGMERSFLREATKNILPDKVRLNHHVRGIQGADTIHRMTSAWTSFYDEIQELISDSLMKDLINLEVVKNALSYIGRVPRPEIIFEDEFKIVTRCLIVYRFIKNLDKGGERSEKSMANTRIGSA